MQLREYQEKAIENIRHEFLKGKNRVILQVPTGGGKTIISAFMIKTAIDKGLKVLFLVHLKELIDQTSEKVALFNVEHGVICAGYEPDYDSSCQLAMVQTLKNRIDKIDFTPDLIIVDECHHCASPTYTKTLEKFPKARVVGLSATPERLDGKGLSQAGYEVIVSGPDMKWLQKNGFLNEYQYLSVPKEVDFSQLKTSMGDYSLHEAAEAVEQAGILGDAVEHYREKLNGKQVIVFCTTIAHSEYMAERFNKAGFAAAHLDGKMKKKERKEVIGKFRSGEILILCNCSLISEGFDVPDCSGVIMLRPTKSLGLYLQMVGRALRPSEDKTIILDHVGNYKNHGLPCDKRIWNLEGKKKRKKEKLEVKPKTCQKCFTVYNSKQYRKCPACNYQNPAESRREIEEYDGKLVEIDGVKIERNDDGGIKKQSLYKLINTCQSLQEMYRLASKLGYKKGWAFHAWKEREERIARRRSTKVNSNGVSSTSTREAMDLRFGTSLSQGER